MDFRSNGHARVLKMKSQPWWRMLSQLRTIEVYAARVGFCQVRIAPAQYSGASSDLDYRAFRMLWIRCALDTDMERPLSWRHLVMRNLLALLGFALVVFLAVGWYMDWYSFASKTDTIEIGVNKKKMVDDAEAVKKKASDAMHSVTGDGKK
jgi:hypothetical protein